MSNRDERNLTLIQSTKVETEAKTEKESSRQTNPMQKKFVEFHHDKAEKFSVKDLFKR